VGCSRQLLPIQPREGRIPSICSCAGCGCGRLSITPNRAHVDLVNAGRRLLFHGVEYVRGGESAHAFSGRARRLHRRFFLSPQSATHRHEIPRGARLRSRQDRARRQSLPPDPPRTCPVNSVCPAPSMLKLTDFGIAKASTHPEAVFTSRRSRQGRVHFAKQSRAEHVAQARRPVLARRVSLRGAGRRAALLGDLPLVVVDGLFAEGRSAFAQGCDVPPGSTAVILKALALESAAALPELAEMQERLGPAGEPGRRPACWGRAPAIELGPPCNSSGCAAIILGDLVLLQPWRCWPPASTSSQSVSTHCGRHRRAQARN